MNDTINDLMPTVQNNLVKLLAKHNITQKQLAAVTGYSEAIISDYKTGKKFPTIDFFFELKKAYNISIDDFISKSINPADLSVETPSSEIERNERLTYQKFCGTYFVYYFDTSKYKGRDYNSPEESLVFGVLHIYENPTTLKKSDYSCIAVLGIKDRQTVRKLKEYIEKIPTSSEAETYINENYSKNAYHGDFELTSDHAFLSMSHENKDKALLILHRVNSNKGNYTGGLGTINSVSKGREPMPVIQFLGISRYRLTLSAEEIHHNLLLNFPNIKANDETEDLIRLFKSLYMVPNEYSESLTDLQKAITIKANLERYIRKSLERNIFRYGKISNRDDDDWYHMLKEVTVDKPAPDDPFSR